MKTECPWGVRMWSLLPLTEFGLGINLKVPSWLWTGIRSLSAEGVDHIWITAISSVTLFL